LLVQTINHAAALLSESLGVPRARIDKIASHLRSVSLLPTGRRGPGGAAGITAEDAATLLLGVMAAADRPTDAAAFVRAIGSLPATHLSALAPGNGAGQVLQFCPVEDVPIPESQGPAVVGMTRSFLSFLETVIAAQAADVPPEYPSLPQTIAVLGNLSSPIAMADLPSLPGGHSALLFTSARVDAEQIATRNFWSWHYASGEVLRQLGNLLAGRRNLLTNVPTAASQPLEAA
jgi:hypothetical protein